MHFVHQRWVYFSTFPLSVPMAGMTTMLTHLQYLITFNLDMLMFMVPYKCLHDDCNIILAVIVEPCNELWPTCLYEYQDNFENYFEFSVIHWETYLLSCEARYHLKKTTKKKRQCLILKECSPFFCFVFVFVFCF